MIEIRKVEDKRRNRRKLYGKGREGEWREEGERGREENTTRELGREKRKGHDLKSHGTGQKGTPTDNATIGRLTPWHHPPS